MVSPAWGLLGQQQNNALGMFQIGAQIGGQLRQRQEQREERNALTAYATNPNEETLAGVAPYNPGLVIQQRGVQAQAQQQQQEQRRADLPTVARLLDGVTDDASYQQTLAQARQYGINVDGAPPSYDPQWVQSTKQLVTAMQTPQGQEALSTAGKLAADMGLRPGTPEFNAKVGEIFQAEQIKTVPFQAGGGIASVNTATGQVTPLVVPQDYGGSQQVGMGQAAPSPGIPRLTSPAEVSRLRPGEQFYDPDGNLRQAPGGPTQPASGGF